MSFVVEKKKSSFSMTNTIPSNSGYKMSPHNSVSYEGITINQITIINESFIKKVIERKIKIKLDIYLKYVLKLLSVEDDDADSEGDVEKIDVVLDDLSRYKSIIQNNYRVHLEQAYYEILIKKIEVIEAELKKKREYINNYFQEKENSKKSR